MTESLEMYLETISLLYDKMRIARVTDIATELGVSKPSVHAALHELERRGLITHEHYGEVFLSPEGKEASAEIRRRHGLLTTFLREVVGGPARHSRAGRLPHRALPFQGDHGAHNRHSGRSRRGSPGQGPGPGIGSALADLHRSVLAGAGSRAASAVPARSPPGPGIPRVTA